MIMNNCYQHTKEIAGVSDMKQLANMVGDLHYETLEQFVGYLGIKLYKDGLKDRLAGRTKLGYSLTDASNHLTSAAIHIRKAFVISKPFMKQ